MSDWKEQAIAAAFESIAKGDAACAETLARQVLDDDPENVGAWLALALVLVESNRNDEALDASLKAFKRARDGMSCLVLARSLVKTGHVELAEKLLNKLADGVSDEQGRGAVFGTLGYLLLGQDRLVEAVEAFRTCVRHHPRAVAAWIALAECLLDLGNPEQALVAADRAFDEDPSEALALVHRGRCLMRLQRTTEAEFVLRRASESTDAARQAEAWKWLALALYRQARADEAVELLRKIEPVFPDDTSVQTALSRALTAVGQLEAARDHASRAQDLEQVAHLESLLDQEQRQGADAGKRANWWMNIGTRLLGDGEPQAAMRCYRRALVLDPEDPDGTGHFGVSSAWLMLKQPQPALEWVDRARSSNPRDPNILVNRALLFKAVERFDDAEHALNEALAHHGISARFRQLCLEALASCLVQLERAEEAIAVTEELAKDGELSDEALLTRGFARVQQGRWAEAEEEMLRSAARSGRPSAVTLNGLGYVRLRQSKYAEAREVLLDAIAQNPSLAAAYRNLSACLQRSGDEESAHAALQVSAALQPGSEYSADTLMRTTSALRSGAVLPIVAARFLAGAYADAVSQQDNDTVAQLAELVPRVCYCPTLAYIGHMTYTGHDRAATEFLLASRVHVKGPDLLDVGCGVGTQCLFLSLLSNLQLLQDRLETVVGIDRDPVSLAFARSQLSLLLLGRRPRLDFLYGDVATSDWRPPAGRRFATVLCCYIWPWVSDALPQVMSNLARSLVPGGHMILVGEFPDRATPSPFLEYARLGTVGEAVPLDDIEAAGRDAGLTVVERRVDIEVPTPEPEHRHTMFGAVLQRGSVPG